MRKHIYCTSGARSKVYGSELSYTLESFLQDVAQVTGEFDYSAFMREYWTDDEIRKLNNFRRRWQRACDNNDEDRLAYIGEQIRAMLDS